MFWSITEQAGQKLEDVRRVLDTTEKIRETLYSQLPPADGSPIVAELISLQATAPRRSAWSLYDHCAAITRLYAVFEGFVDALVQEYLEALPAIYPIYVELPAPIATQHRLGVAQILSKLGDQGLFKHLTEQETLKGISAGNAGSPYTLLADAFLTDQQNYRAEQLNKIFGYLNLNNIWAGVEKHPAVAFYMTSRDPGEKPQGILKTLVEDRNRASHYAVTETLSTPELISLANFVGAVVQALAEICRKHCLTLEHEIGLRKKLFVVTHLYRDGALGGTFTGGELAVGDNLMAIGQEGAFRVTVVSLQHHDAPLVRAEASMYPQLGIKLDRPVAKRTVLVALHRTVAAAPVQLDPVAPRREELNILQRLVAWCRQFI